MVTRGDCTKGWEGQNASKTCFVSLSLTCTELVYVTAWYNMVHSQVRKLDLCPEVVDSLVKQSQRAIANDIISAGAYLNVLATFQYHCKSM